MNYGATIKVFKQRRLSGEKVGNLNSPLKTQESSVPDLDAQTSQLLHRLYLTVFDLKVFLSQLVRHLQILINSYFKK